eukprot:4831276-Lingulodinium_polyedra.AAC.1
MWPSSRSRPTPCSASLSDVHRARVVPARLVSPSCGAELLGRAEADPRLVPAHRLSTCCARLLDPALCAPWRRS